MEEIRTVGVKELKNSLSAYLREVRRGVRILVTDRKRVVAELREPGATPSVEHDPVLTEWIEAGVVSPPARERPELPPTPISLPDGTAQRLIDRDRGESGR